MLGPICIYAFDRLILPLQDIDAYDDHPSSRIRLRLLLKLFDEAGFATALSGVSKEEDKTISLTSLEYFQTYLKSVVDRESKVGTDPLTDLLLYAEGKLENAVVESIDSIIRSES